ncbi:MAG: 4Fe-4S dicluster domain-containing protein [Candidatus Thermoplasmatota archaeon]|nr:4Fe-4S dicluster domain-containing protein [Candidatus Thermoplasmatota archaeon]
MKKVLIKKKDLPSFFSQLIVRYRIFAPVEKNGLFWFRPIENFTEIALDFSNSTMPPKALFFQQTETLLTFKKQSSSSIKIEIPAEKNKMAILFGIRPCDAKSIELLDTIFLKDDEDPYYRSKRKNTLLVGLSCIRPSLSCFCTSLGGGPANTDGLDILFTDIDESFFVEGINEKGITFIKEFIEFFTPATEEDNKKRESVAMHAQKMITRRMTAENTEKTLDKIFESSYWEKNAQRCIGCGICTFLCPTCHCFDIHDETNAASDHGARIRVWDSCMYPEYTKQASGYNPRPTRMNRLRNRVYHKFNYIPKNHQVFGCVGCGRCIDNCPMAIDIIDIVNNAQEVQS